MPSVVLIFALELYGSAKEVRISPALRGKSFSSISLPYLELPKFTLLSISSDPLAPPIPELQNADEVRLISPLNPRRQLLLPV
jgi:hypothetical protein